MAPKQYENTNKDFVWQHRCVVQYEYSPSDPEQAEQQKSCNDDEQNHKTTNRCGSQNSLNTVKPVVPLSGENRHINSGTCICTIRDGECQLLLNIHIYLLD